MQEHFADKYVFIDLLNVHLLCCPNRATGVNLPCVLSSISGLRANCKLFARLFGIFELILVKGAFSVLQPGIHTAACGCGWAQGQAGGGAPRPLGPDVKETGDTS